MWYANFVEKVIMLLKIAFKLKLIYLLKNFWKDTKIKLKEELLKDKIPEVTILQAIFQL